MAEEEDEKSQRQNYIPEKIKSALTNKSHHLDLTAMDIISIPSDLYKLRNLQILQLSSNYIASISEAFAENFSNLTWLDLRCNKLEYLPKNINLLIKLKNLLLQGNHIKELPIQLGSLQQLSGLNITENPIVFPPKHVVKKGTKVILEYLRQYVNQIEMNEVTLTEINGLNNFKENKDKNINTATEDTNNKELVELKQIDNIDTNDEAVSKKTTTQPVIENSAIDNSLPPLLVKEPSKTEISVLNERQQTNPKNHLLEKSNKIEKTSLKLPFLTDTNPIKKYNEKTNEVSSKTFVKKRKKRLTTKLNTDTFEPLKNKQITRKSLNSVTYKIENDNKDKDGYFQKQQDATRDYSLKNVSKNLPENSPNKLKNFYPDNSSKNLMKMQNLNISKQIKKDKMVALKVSSSFSVPGQPCIGKIVDFGQDKKILVHYYTGSYSGEWYPMMVRTSPYLRAVNEESVLIVFDLDNTNRMSDDVIRNIKKLS